MGEGRSGEGCERRTTGRRERGGECNPHERHLRGRVDVGPRCDQPVRRIRVASHRRDEEGRGPVLPGRRGDAGGRDPSQPGRGPPGPHCSRQGARTAQRDAGVRDEAGRGIRGKREREKEGGREEQEGGGVCESETGG